MQSGCLAKVFSRMTRILHFLHSSALWPSELNPLFLLLGPPLYCAVQWWERRSGLHVGVPDPGGEAFAATGIAVRGREMRCLPRASRQMHFREEPAGREPGSFSSRNSAGVLCPPPALTAPCILKTTRTYILWTECWPPSILYALGSLLAKHKDMSRKRRPCGLGQVPALDWDLKLNVRWWTGERNRIKMKE